MSKKRLRCQACRLVPVACAPKFDARNIYDNASKRLSQLFSFTPTSCTIPLLYIQRPQCHPLNPHIHYLPIHTSFTFQQIFPSHLGLSLISPYTIHPFYSFAQTLLIPQLLKMNRKGSFWETLWKYNNKIQIHIKCDSTCEEYFCVRYALTI